MFNTNTITSQVRPQFLMRGERVHAPRSAQTWDGQVVSVVKTHRTAGAYTNGVPSILVDAKDVEGRPVSFFVPQDGWVTLAD